MPRRRNAPPPPRSGAGPARSAPGPDSYRSRRSDELLRLAAKVFAERGYHAASMRGIASRAGVQAAAIYYYFPSKAKILEAICRYAIDQFLDRVGAIARSDLPAEEKLRGALRAHLEPLIEQRFYVHAFLFQRRELPPDARRPLDAQAHAYEALWQTILLQGQREGVIDRSLDVEMTVLALLGMCNAVARWSRAGTDTGLDRVAEAFTRLVSRGLFDNDRAISRKAAQDRPAGRLRAKAKAKVVRP